MEHASCEGRESEKRLNAAKSKRTVSQQDVRRRYSQMAESGKVGQIPWPRGVDQLTKVIGRRGYLRMQLSEVDLRDVVGEVWTQMRLSEQDGHSREVIEARTSREAGHVDVGPVKIWLNIQIIGIVQEYRGRVVGAGGGTTSAGGLTAVGRPRSVLLAKESFQFI